MPAHHIPGSGYANGARAGSAVKAGDRGATLTEMADAQTVIDHLKCALGFSTQELNDAVCEKQRTHGGFSCKRLTLLETFSPEVVK